MNTTTKILDNLRISYLIYDNYREACYQKWCKIHAKQNAISLRAMMTHDGLRNWYQDQWQFKVEGHFVKNYESFFGKAEIGVLMDLLFEYPQAIHDYYPGPLLEMIKTETNGVLEPVIVEGARSGIA